MKFMLLSSVRPFYAAEKEEGAGETEETTEKVEGELEEVEKKPEVKEKEVVEETEEEDKPTPFDDPIVQKELGRKHRQLNEKDRELAETKRELADAKALLNRRGKTEDGDEATEPEKTLTPDDVKREARAIVAQQNYDEQCNTAYGKGKEVYGDKWDKSVKRIADMGGVSVEDMQSILATDDPAKVLYELGSNPAEYQRIMELPEARRRNEMTKIALKEAPKTATKISKAPEPVDEVRTKSKVSTEPSDDDDDDTWYKKRAAQRAANRKRA